MIIRLSSSTLRRKRPETRPRLIGLDVLRFLAVSLVLHVHALQAFGTPAAGKSFGSWEILLALLPLGMYGVDIFFVLSGFLVSGLFFQELARTGTVSPGRFLIRRGFKIYPAFWLLIVVTVVVQFFQTGKINTKGLLAELFFFQNYVMGLWYHTWTLAVEEHFYLLLAGLFLVLKSFPDPHGKPRLNVIPRVVDVIILSCLAARIVTWWFSYQISTSHPQLLTSATHVRLDALFFGVWLAHGWHNTWSNAFKNRLLAWRWGWAALGLLLISPISDRLLSIQVWRIFGFMLVYVGAGCLLIAALSLDHFRRPAWLEWLAWLGKHSYSVYLWHMLVLAGVRPLLGPISSSFGNYLLKELIFVAASWTIGIIMARLIEFPMLRLRDKWFPGREQHVKLA